MKSHISVAAVSIVLFVASCTKESLTGQASDPIVNNVHQQTILNLVNQVRQTGCNCAGIPMPAVPALAWNNKLSASAYKHSVDMNNTGSLNHNGSDGSTFDQRITNEGYTWTSAGENIAWNYPTEQDVINGWLGDEPHCKNIMNANFSEMGVGREGAYWTQDFGHP